MKDSQLITVGRMTYVHLHKGVYVDIPAKIDTGADASAIDASHVQINEAGQLEYILFQPHAAYYDGILHKTSKYRVKVVKSSTGHVQIRYTINLPLYICGKKINATFTLTDRSKNTFPILIGARTLKNKFAVDVSYNYDEYRTYINERKDPFNTLSSRYTEESSASPVRFYNDVYLKQEDK